jgi:hypothetical protein
MWITFLCVTPCLLCVTLCYSFFSFTEGKIEYSRLIRHLADG